MKETPYPAGLPSAGEGRPPALVVDVLCLGFACYDLIFSVDRHVGADEKIKATELDLLRRRASPQMHR